MTAPTDEDVRRVRMLLDKSFRHECYPDNNSPECADCFAQDEAEGLLVSLLSAVRAEERERLLGQGRKMKPATRLASLVEDVRGFEAMGLDPRREGEDIADYRIRVVEFFSSEDGQELAEHAVLYRGLAVSPQSTFRGGPNSGMAEHLRGQEAERPVPALPDVRSAGQGPEGWVPEVSADQGGNDAKEACKG